MKIRINQNGFSSHLFIGALLLILFIGAAGYYVYMSNNNKISNKSSKLNDYYWMITEGQLGKMINSGLSPALQNYFFNNSHTLLIINKQSVLDSKFPKALKVKNYTSEAQIASDSETGFPSGLSYIAYDGESWAQTPENEQHCPIDYAEKAKAIVNQKGLGFIYTPAINLSLKLNNSTNCKTVLNTSKKYSISGAAPKYAAFLNQNFAGLAAPNSDIFEIQAQQLEPNSAGFNYFSSIATDQANQATRKKVPILIGLTTDDSAQTMTLQELTDAYNGTKSFASGYWLNIPATGTPNPDLAVSFLQEVYKLQANH